jgi:hypothetical protein
LDNATLHNNGAPYLIFGEGIDREHKIPEKSNIPDRGFPPCSPINDSKIIPQRFVPLQAWTKQSLKND